MSKLELPTGQDNIIVRNQEVYGYLPKDVIDRMGDTSTQLATEDQTALGAINELKSNLTELESEVDDKLKLTVIRSVATWNVGSSYTFTQGDWDKYTEFHVFISHANVANPSYYEIVFNKYFYTVQRIVGYGGASGNNYVQMSGDSANHRLTLNAAVNASTSYNPLIGIYGR